MCIKNSGCGRGNDVDVVSRFAGAATSFAGLKPPASGISIASARAKKLARTLVRIQPSFPHRQPSGLVDEAISIAEMG